jgi:hypothetical protein
MAEKGGKVQGTNLAGSRGAARLKCQDLQRQVPLAFRAQKVCTPHLHVSSLILHYYFFRMQTSRCRQVVRWSQLVHQRL